MLDSRNAILDLINLVFLMGKLSFKKYKTQTAQVEFEYPANWKDSIEEGSTYLFWDEMLGSFRITPLIVKNENFNLKKYLTDTFINNKANNVQWKKLNERDFVYCEQDGRDNSQLYFYISGNGNIILICSYAYDKSLIDKTKIKGELKKVERVLESLSFN